MYTKKLNSFTNVAGYYPPSESATYTESSEGGKDWLAKLSREWEGAAQLPEGSHTRTVIIRSGREMPYFQNT